MRFHNGRQFAVTEVHAGENASVDLVLLQREGEQARRERVTEQLADLVDLVVEFDQSRINCKECPERLKLNRKQRETVLGFHAELMADLADLQKYAGTAIGQCQ